MYSEPAGVGAVSGHSGHCISPFSPPHAADFTARLFALEGKGIYRVMVISIQEGVDLRWNMLTRARVTVATSDGCG